MAVKVGNVKAVNEVWFCGWGTGGVLRSQQNCPVHRWVLPL